MKNGIFWGSWTIATGLAIASIISSAEISSAEIARANQPLTVVYPPDGHETSAAQIFLIGTAPGEGDVQINDRAIARSPAGHFAPSFPLQMGDNVFTVRYQGQTVTLHVSRVSDQPPAPVGLGFAEGSLTPAVDISRAPDELICFGAIAPPGSAVSVTLGGINRPLLPQPSPVTLPPNSAVLTQGNQPASAASPAGVSYQGCEVASQWIGDRTLPSGPRGLELGTPEFILTQSERIVVQPAPGMVSILPVAQRPVIEVTALSGTARTGPSTDYSRLTPLPTGTRATVTGTEGDWLRLDYGAWIRAADTQPVPNAIPPHSLIRSISSRVVEGATEIRFPLQTPVPVSVQQGDRTFSLTLYNTTAQTDIIQLNDDPIIARLDWTQPNPEQVVYIFNLKSAQQWGYTLRYEGTTLVLTLRHPPTVAPSPSRTPLAGVSIVLDPGHGGPEDLGSRGPTGYPEKEVTLVVSRLLRDRLEALGATVYMTRDGDDDLYPQDRVDQINQLAPTLAISIHYNALPDSGNAEQTAGVGTFWYNAQAHSLAVFLHNYLVETLDRPSYGVFWDNLALTRPTVAPAVLLELGFMINPNEFEWITNPEAQAQLAEAIANGVTAWLHNSAAAAAAAAAPERSQTP